MEGGYRGAGGWTSQHKGDSLPECIWVGEIKGRQVSGAVLVNEVQVKGEPIWSWKQQMTLRHSPHFLHHPYLPSEVYTPQKTLSGSR